MPGQNQRWMAQWVTCAELVGLSTLGQTGQLARSRCWSVCRAWISILFRQHRLALYRRVPMVEHSHSPGLAAAEHASETTVYGMLFFSGDHIDLNSG
jgi:hypothetical protein